MQKTSWPGIFFSAAFLSGIFLSGAALTAQAQDTKSPQGDNPANVPARYSFDRVQDTFLRLDTATGQVAVCSQHAAGWACQAVPEDRVALEREIGRLQDEVAALKSEVATLRAPSPPRPPADLTPPDKNGAKGNVLILPTQDDMERAKAAVQHAWRRLVDMLVGFTNDVMKRG